jgi:hypothetical protein
MIKVAFLVVLLLAPFVAFCEWHDGAWEARREARRARVEALRESHRVRADVRQAWREAEREFRQSAREATREARRAAREVRARNWDF